MLTNKSKVYTARSCLNKASAGREPGMLVWETQGVQALRSGEGSIREKECMDVMLNSKSLVSVYPNPSASSI